MGVEEDHVVTFNVAQLLCGQRKETADRWQKHKWDWWTDESTKLMNMVD